jgi:hypothetical protein
MIFYPHLEILATAQMRLWHELSTVPDEFVLYGGTALALHLGHRNSLDFDFFSRRPLDLAQLEVAIPFLTGAKITQREKNTLSAIVERGGPVKVSFFGVPKLLRLATALAAAHALYGPTFNPEVTLKALSYFDDGNLRDLPDDLKLRLVNAAREVDLDHLPVLGADLRRADTDFGLEQ